MSQPLVRHELSREAVEPPEILIDSATLYHGSAIQGIDEMHRAEETTVGSGIYIVDNPQQAAGYAKLRAQERRKATPTVYEALVEHARLVNLYNPEKLHEVMYGFANDLRRTDTSNMSWIREGAIKGAIEKIDSGRGMQPGTVKLVTQNVGAEFTAYLKGLALMA